MTRLPFIGVKTMLEPSIKKTKNQLERQLKAGRKQQQKYLDKYRDCESREYSLLCQIYRLKGRCYPCEKNTLMPQGRYLSISPECLRPLGVK